jgi:NAD(P)-dependent dehydrogenase (short-subunit alcohol dehydrogenase family)
MSPFEKIVFIQDVERISKLFKMHKKKLMGLLLKDKVIFLTGGAAGIGYECAKVYIQEGAILVVFDKLDPKIDGLCMNFVGDVSDAAAKGGIWLDAEEVFHID